METTNKVRKKELLRKKMRTGDLITAAEALGITVDAFRMRLNRDKEDAIKALKAVIKNRENFVSNYQIG